MPGTIAAQSYTPCIVIIHKTRLTYAIFCWIEVLLQLKSVTKLALASRRAKSLSLDLVQGMQGLSFL